MKKDSNRIDSHLEISGYLKEAEDEITEKLKEIDEREDHPVESISQKYGDIHLEIAFQELKMLNSYLAISRESFSRSLQLEDRFQLTFIDFGRIKKFVRQIDLELNALRETLDRFERESDSSSFSQNVFSHTNRILKAALAVFRIVLLIQLQKK